MPQLNIIQQISTVPVQTPPLANNKNFSFGWIQWFQNIYQACKVIPIPSTDVPANPSVIVGYTVALNSQGQKIFTPYYQ